LPAPEGRHAPAGECRLSHPARGARPAVAEGRPQDRAARAPRHLPGAAARSGRQPPDRPPGPRPAPPRRDQALPPRRSPRDRPRRDAQEDPHAPDGLRVAADLLARHPSNNQHIIVITDGQPTAYFLRGRLYCEWPLSFGGISMRAAQETLREVERVTRRGITINTFMLDDSPSLR